MEELARVNRYLLALSVSISIYERFNVFRNFVPRLHVMQSPYYQGLLDLNIGARTHEGSKAVDTF